MVGNPNADGASFGMQHSLRHLSGSRHDEGELPRSGCLKSAEDHIIEVHEPTQLIEVGAYQGEVVLIVQLTDFSNPVQARSIVQLAPEGETRICGVRDKPVSAQEVDHTANSARLRVVRVDVEVSGHEWSLVRRHREFVPTGAGGSPEAQLVGLLDDPEIHVL
jgi:hypothetical protein